MIFFQGRDRCPCARRGAARWLQPTAVRSLRLVVKRRGDRLGHQPVAGFTALAPARSVASSTASSISRGAARRFSSAFFLSFCKRSRSVAALLRAARFRRLLVELLRGVRSVLDDLLEARHRILATQIPGLLLSWSCVGLGVHLPIAAASRPSPPRATRARASRASLPIGVVLLSHLLARGHAASCVTGPSSASISSWAFFRAIAASFLASCRAAGCASARASRAAATSAACRVRWSSAAF